MDHSQANTILDDVRRAKNRDDLNVVAKKYRTAIELMKDHKELAVRVIHIRNLWELKAIRFKYSK